MSFKTQSETIREAMARAWDAGALAGHMEAASDEAIENPYRGEAPKWRPTADDLDYPEEGTR